MPVSDESLRRIIEETLGQWNPEQNSSAPKVLCLSLAIAISKGCVAKASEIGLPVSIAVSDEAGNLILFNRMPKALLVSVDIAPKKAYTCVALNMSTEQAGEFIKKETPGLDTAVEGKFVLFAGGLPIYINGGLAGAVGVSGGLPAQDKAVAEAGLRAAGLL